MRTPFSRHDPRILVLAVCRSIAALGFSIVFPFLSIYLHSEMGVSMTAIGTLFLASSAAGGLAQLAGGELSDRLGRKRVMIAAFGIRAVMFFLMSVAVLQRAQFGVLAALVIGTVFTGRLFEPASNAMISDVTGSNRRQEAFALVRIGMNLGWAIGPAMGGFLASFSYAFLFLTSGILSIAGLVLLLARLKDTQVGTRSVKLSLHDVREIVRDRTFSHYSMISLLLFVVTAQLMMTLSVYAVDWVGISKIELGYLYTLNGLMVVVLQFPCVRLVQRFRISRVLALSSLLYAVGYFSMAFAPAVARAFSRFGAMGGAPASHGLSGGAFDVAGLAAGAAAGVTGAVGGALGGGFLTLLVCMAVVTLGEILMGPASLALVANMAPAARYGRYMGVYGLSDSVGHSLGPFLGGIVMDASAGNSYGVWGAVGVVGLAACVGFLQFGKRLTRDTDVLPPEMPPGGISPPQ
ncbi:MAG: MFS transporter [Candidatus Eisenbacteria bacterium]